MALPFGICDASEAFHRVQDFEEEQEDQLYEEELSKSEEFVLRLSPTFRELVNATDEGETNLSVSQFIVTSDSIGAAFVDSYLKEEDNAMKIGLITGPFTSPSTGNTVCQTSLWDKSCFLYSLDGKPDVIVCQMKQSLDEKFMYDWVDKVFSVIKPKSVVALTAVPKSGFQLGEEKDNGLDTLFQLRSDSCENKTNIPNLPRPNLIGDLPAAVLTHCQVKSIPAVMYILATEALHFDVTAVKSFAPILGEDILSGIQKKPESKVKEALKTLCKLNVPSNGVYI